MISLPRRRPRLTRLSPVARVRGRLRPKADRRVGPRFEVVGRTRPFELLSPGFVALEERPGSVQGRMRSDYSPPAPYATVEVRIDEAHGTVVAGLTSDDGAHLLSFYDPAAGRVGLELRARGTTTVIAQRRVRGRVRRMAFVLCETKPTVLVDTGRGWRPVAHGGHRVAPRTDFRVPEVLARYRATWGSRGAASEIGLVRAGLFGMAGLRDLHLVQHADGSPYVEGGRMFLTATCAGLGFFRQAHWGVFAFDPSALGRGVVELEQTAHLFSRREGKIFGDHAGQLVRDGDRWLVAVSSWGDFSPQRGVYIRRTTSDGDLLHGVHVLDTQPASMPTERGHYDPGMTRIDGRWHVSYVESVGHQPSRFHPALAIGPEGAEDWTKGLERVGEASDLTFCEGPILARPDGPHGEWRVLASDGDESARRYRVFDLRMRHVGDLDAPYGTNLPHPQVIDLPDGERVIVTFDGTRYARRRLAYGTHGDVIVMRAARPGS